MQLSAEPEIVSDFRGRAVGARIGHGVPSYSASGFLVALVMLIIAASFVRDLQRGAIIESILVTLVLVSGVWAAGGRTRSLVLACLLGVPAVVGRWIDHYWPGLLPPGLFPMVSLSFAAFVAVQLLWFVLRAPRVNQEVLCAAVSVYLLIGIVWALAYILVGRLVPGAFAFSVGDPDRSLRGFEAGYFSFVTLTTCGYGDIVPVANTARMLAMLEAIAGTFYMATLIARLVSLYSSSRGSGRAQDR